MKTKLIVEKTVRENIEVAGEVKSISHIRDIETQLNKQANGAALYRVVEWDVVGEPVDAVEEPTNGENK